MFGLPTEFLLDGLMAVLLAATVFYCALLDRRLKALRNGQDGFRQTIEQLNTATARAEVSIAQLKQASGTIDETLGVQIREARILAAELARSVQVGNAEPVSNKRPARSAEWVADALKAAAKTRDQTATQHEPQEETSSQDRYEDVPQAALETGLNQSLLDALKRAR
ncbi:MAG: DUF6468 domain-containing protein [Parvibaculum sp.]